MHEVAKYMRLALTYNIKKESPENERTSALNFSPDTASRIDTSELAMKYPERMKDTFAEWDTEETILAVKSALENYGHTVDLIEADLNVYENLKKLNPEFVFNIAEGFGGASRESFVPSMLEMLDIPFTGSDSVTIGICHDKSRCKEILSYHGVPNPEFVILNNIDDAENVKLKFPLFVKPLHEGSSKGIFNSCVVNDMGELKKETQRICGTYSQPAIAETYLEGREFTVAILGNGESLKVLPIVEINLDCVPEGFNKIYSYEVKWFFDTPENDLDIFKCPADLKPELRASIEKTAKDTCRALRLRDWARMDIRLDADGTPNVIEVNPLPGILPNPVDNSCFPKAARVAGIDYNAMINAVLNSAKKRYEDSHSL